MEFFSKGLTFQVNHLALFFAGCTFNGSTTQPLTLMKNMNAVVLFGGLLIFGSLLIYSFVSGSSLLAPLGKAGDLMIERVVLGVLLAASVGLSFFLGNRK